jgi:pyruvate dehydrogenase E2 component (dihydrolipoamide acetyltransferase)
MSAAWSAAPMVTYHAGADATNLTGFREMLNRDVTDKAERVSVNDLILKITATALKTMPVMNALLTDEGIVRHSGVQLGMATVIDGGLLVPVIRDADGKSLLEISREAKELAARARAGRLTPDETHGGTFTVSNIGGYGSVDFFTPIVNAPQVGILGVGRLTDTVVAVNGEMKIRPMLGLSLTCDHRVIDGAVAAEFMRILIRLLENPARASILTGRYTA